MPKAPRATAPARRPDHARVRRDPPHRHRAAPARPQGYLGATNPAGLSRDAEGAASHGYGPPRCRRLCSRRNPHAQGLSLAPSRAGPVACCGRPECSGHSGREDGRQGGGGLPGVLDVPLLRSPRAASAGSRWAARHGPGVAAAQADRRARPLLRRFATMARPARVRIRSRKPWVFARRRLFGWKVRLLTRGLQECFVSRGCPRDMACVGRRRLSPCAHEKLATPECTASGPAKLSDLAHRRQAAAAVDNSTWLRYARARHPVKPPIRPSTFTGHGAEDTRTQPVDNDLKAARRPDYRDRTSQSARPIREPPLPTAPQRSGRGIGTAHPHRTTPP